MEILITGGAGFIGSTVGSAAEDSGHRVVVLDNLSTGRREFAEGRAFYEGDIGDDALVDRVFTENPDIECVVHCAAHIVVPDSVARPAEYYINNVSKTLAFVESMRRNGVDRLLFSSSAAIYEPSDVDFSVDEDSPTRGSSPYARTKAMTETILEDIAAATDLRVLSLRYFNPIGSDPKLRTGLQLPAPSHALGKLIDAHAAGDYFNVTGDDYLTRDGSGIRDYIHVWDLAHAHIAAIENFDDVVPETHRAINLGTGSGTTVFELVEAFNNVVDDPVKFRRAPRRPGDIAGAYTRSERASRELGWVPEHSIEEGIRDSLAWFAHRGTVLPEFA